LRDEVFLASRLDVRYPEDPSAETIHLNEIKTKGVTIVEYVIILALLAIAVAISGPKIASAVLNVFSQASSVLNE
jgi:Flp pilus assembly pilin Flp